MARKRKNLLIFIHVHREPFLIFLNVNAKLVRLQNTNILHANQGITSCIPYGHLVSTVEVNNECTTPGVIIIVTCKLCTGEPMHLTPDHVIIGAEATTLLTAGLQQSLIIDPSLSGVESQSIGNGASSSFL